MANEEVREAEQRWIERLRLPSETQPMKRADVWWIDFAPAVGGEVRKERPAVIVSNDASNKHLNR